MKKQSRTAAGRRQPKSSGQRHLPLVDILVDTQAELQQLVVASGVKVLEAMLEEDRVAVCGPRYAHQPKRGAYRAGHSPSQVVLGGRKVAIRRPRVRRDGQELALPTVQAFADAGPTAGYRSAPSTSVRRRRSGHARPARARRPPYPTRQG